MVLRVHRDRLRAIASSFGQFLGEGGPGSEKTVCEGREVPRLLLQCLEQIRRIGLEGSRLGKVIPGITVLRNVLQIEHLEAASDDPSHLLVLVVCKSEKRGLCLFGKLIFAEKGGGNLCDPLPLCGSTADAGFEPLRQLLLYQLGCPATNVAPMVATFWS